jgi:membrane protein insertase Oxa1/YidC/SpoIIIJ
MDSTATLSEGSMFAINTALILLFLALAAFTAVLVLVFGRVFYKHWYSWLRIFGGALFGGLIAVGIFWFSAEFESIRRNESVGSLNDMVEMMILVLLPLMLIIPILSIILRHRSTRIKELQKEIQELKNKQTESNAHSISSSSNLLQ